MDDRARELLWLESELAERGFEVLRRNRHTTMRHPGLEMTVAFGTDGHHRSALNARTQLNRALRGAGLKPIGSRRHRAGKKA